MSVAQFVVSAEQLRSQGKDLKKMIEETNEWLDIMRKIFPEMSPELRECLHRMDRRLGKKGRPPTKKENRRILHKNPT